MSSVIGTYGDPAGKTVVVTGGSRGIGARTAREFAAQGAHVCVVGRDADALAGVVDEIVAKGARAMAVVADVTDAGALADVRARVTETFGAVDVFAVFAGGQGAPTPSLQCSPQPGRSSGNDKEGNGFRLPAQCCENRLIPHGPASTPMAPPPARSHCAPPALRP